MIELNTVNPLFLYVSFFNLNTFQAFSKFFPTLEHCKLYVTASNKRS